MLLAVALALPLAAPGPVRAETRGTGPEPGDRQRQLAPAAWPDSWKNTFAQVERFAELRATTWPRAECALTDSGALSRPPLPATWESRVAWDIYRDGQRRLNRSAKSEKTYLPEYEPGLYAVVLSTYTSRGYQHLGPVRYFYVASTTPLAMTDLATVRPPERGTPRQDAGHGIPHPWHVWPNDWWIAFEDYGVFRYPQFRSAGKREAYVEPSVQLKPGPGDSVSRSLLGSDHERHLRWRVYVDGRLRTEEEAAGQSQWHCRFGPGHYTVLTVAEGPGGGLPVSLPFHYEIPDPAKPPPPPRHLDSDEDGIPDWWELENGLDPHDRNDASADRDNDGLSALEEFRR